MSIKFSKKLGFIQIGFNDYDTDYYVDVNIFENENYFICVLKGDIGLDMLTKTSSGAMIIFDDVKINGISYRIMVVRGLDYYEIEYKKN